MAKISGIYVEIRGDSTQLRKDLATARQHVTEQATGMSNALNNALSPAQLKNNINGIVRNLNTLSQASKLTGKEFGAIGADLKDMQRLTGLSEKAFRDLQSRMIQTSAAKAQEAALRNIAKAANLSAKEVSQLGKQMGVSAAGISAVNGASQSASSALSMLGSAAKSALGFMSVYTVIEFGRAIMDAGLAMDSLQRSFVAITGSQAGAAETLSFLREEAGRLGQNFYALAPEFKNVMAAARGTAMEGENVRKMFSAVAAASTALGLSADDTHGTLRALQQMMSKGKIQAEELRGQLGERLPGALNLMATAMGVSTAELNKMMEDGKLLSDEALPKLAAELERVYGKAAETAALESAQAAVNRLSQAWEEFKINLFDNQAFVFAANSIRLLITAAGKAVGEWTIKEQLVAAQRELKGLEQIDGTPMSTLPGFQSSLEATRKEVARLKDELLQLEKPATDAFLAMTKGLEQAENRAGDYISYLQGFDQKLEKLLQTDRDKIDATYRELSGKVKDQAALEKWYTGEVAKLNEKATKKSIDEQKKQLEAHKKAREAMRKNEAETLSAIDKWMEDYEQQQIEAVANGVAERKKLREDEAKAAADAARKIAEEQEAAAQKVMDNIQDATADVFYDMFQDIDKGWENLWSSMKEWALRTLAELAARAATVQIVVPIMTSMTGTNSAAGAVQAITGGQGGIGNMPFGSLLGGENGMFSGVASSINTWAANTFPGVFGGATLAQAGTPLASVVSSPSASLAAAQAGTTINTPLVSSGTPFLGALGGVAGIGGGIYQMAQGGTGNLIAGAGTAIGGAMMFTPAAPFAPLVMIGSQILGGLFGDKEHSPSIIFDQQSMAWGETDSSISSNTKYNGASRRAGFEFHAKSGASLKTGEPIAAALEETAAAAFASIEATLSAFGDGYVEMLDDAVVKFGRKAGGSWSSWDFGADHDFEELFAKAQADLTGQILKAAEGAFTAAGQDLASGDEAAAALGMLSKKAGEQFKALQDIIAAGVQSGDVEAYITQIQGFQATLQTITATWDAVSQASAELVNPLTQYEQAQRAVNQQYDVWIAQLEAIGFASEKVALIDADRAEVLATLAAENKKAIDDVLRESAQIATPLSEAEVAVQQVNNQFDSLIEQAEALGAAESALAQIEKDRETALKRLGITTAQSTAASLTSEITSGLKAALSGARSALSTAYNAERDRLQDALSATIDGLKGQISGIDRQIAGREDAKSAWESVANSLKSAVSDIMPMSLTQAMSALDGYIQGAFAGNVPDEYGLGRAINAATSISANDYATRADYDRAQSEAAAKLSTLAGISDTRVSVEERQLDALASQREALDAQIALAQSASDAQLDALALAYENAVEQLDALEGIEKYSGTMDEALGMIRSLTVQYGDIQAQLAHTTSLAAVGTLAATQQAVAILSGISTQMTTMSRPDDADIPGFASGGYHSGGLRIVGENGPELEYTGPSRIWSASDTRAMLSVGGSDAAEIRALREDLRAQSRAMVATQQRMTKLLERWNIDGMPEVRTA